MTRAEVNRLACKLTKEERRELNTRFRGWAFQMPPGDDPWWEREVDAAADPGFSRTQAEGYLREIKRLVDLKGAV